MPHVPGDGRMPTYAAGFRLGVRDRLVTRLPSGLQATPPQGCEIHSRDGWCGFSMTLFENAHFSVRCLRYRFRTEKLQIETMMRLNLLGATVLDIGANRGIYCFWMIRAVGASGRVIAFEPQPEMCDTIERQKVRFDWVNVRVMNVALSDMDGQKSLFRQKTRLIKSSFI